MSAAQTKFAIAVPVGRADTTLNWVFASLAAQTAPTTVALLDASCDPRVAAAADAFPTLFTYRRAGADRGQTAAINEGWAATQSDFVGWLNADDVLLPEALAEVAAAFEANPDADVVYGGSLIIDDAHTVVGVHPAVAPISAILRRHCLISQPSCFVRRTALEPLVGLDERYDYAMDWDLWVRLFDAGAKFHFVDRTWSLVSFKAGTKTSSIHPRRLFEVARITARARRADWVLKTLIGVVLHHIRQYTPLSALIRPRRRHRRLSLPFAHYDDEAHDTLSIILDRRAAVTLHMPAGEVIASSAPSERHRIKLGVPIAAAQSVLVSIVGERPFELVGMRWGAQPSVPMS